MSRFLCILAIMAFAQAASAEERHILLRLMDKPVTLFDWGMAQLDRDEFRKTEDVEKELNSD